MAFKLHTIYKQKINSDGYHWSYYYKEGKPKEKWRIGVHDNKSFGADHSNTWLHTEPAEPEILYDVVQTINNDHARYEFIQGIFRYVEENK